MLDKIDKMFNSCVFVKSPKLPKGGYSYLFEWSKEEDKEKWKSDGYKWGRKRYMKKISETITKSCYYVYLHATSCSKSFVRQVYYNSKWPQRVVICYKGDCRKALCFSKSDNNKGIFNKTLFLKNLPANSTEASVSCLHPCITQVKLDESKDNSKTKYALVAFKSIESVLEAKEVLNNRVMNGNTVTADFLSQNLAVSFIQHSNFLSSSQDPCTLFVTGFDSDVSKRQVYKLFATCSSITFEGLCNSHNNGDGDEEEEDGDEEEDEDTDDQSFRYCHVRYSGAEEARRVLEMEQDRNDMVVMYARR